MTRRQTKAPDAEQVERALPLPLEFAVPLWRHRGLFLATFAGVTVLSVLSAFVISPKYVATGSVILAEPDPAMTRATDAWTQKLGDPADLESQTVILESPRLLGLAVQQPGAYDAVMAECRAAGDSKCLGYKPDSVELIEHVAKQYSANTAGRSRVIEISYKSRLPATAKVMANALVETYLDDQKASMSDGREVAAKWMWQELADLDKEIRDKDAKIEAYRRDNGLVSGATAPISSERLSGVAEQLALAQKAEAQAQGRLDAIRDVRNGGDAGSTSNVLGNRTIADLKQQIAAVRRDLASRGAVLGPRHPQLIMLQDSLSSLQRQLNEEVERIATSAQRDYDTAVGQVASLQKQMDAAQATAATAASDESSIEGMVRDVAVKRDLYAQLYQRASAMETERRSLAGSARLVSLAQIPIKPYFPKKWLFAVAGVVLGLMLATLFCLVWDRFGGLIRSSAIASALPRKSEDDGAAPLAILASLPDLPSPSLLDAGAMTLSLTLRRSAASRSMQHALAALLQDIRRLDTVGPLLVVPAETGSADAAFLSLALGQVAARNGSKVLVVECTPGATDVVTAFGIRPDAVGLADILSGGVLPAQAAVAAGTGGIDVIPAGTSDFDAMRGPQKRRFKALLDWAKAYDLVLLSTSSTIDDASTAQLLPLAGKSAPMLVCVSRAQLTDEVLAEAGAEAEKSGVKAIGAVVVPHLDRGEATSRDYKIAVSESA